MPQEQIDSIEELFRHELDLARERRREAEAHLQKVSERVYRAYTDPSDEVTSQTGPEDTIRGHVPVLGIRIGGRAKAYPFPLLAKKGVANDSLGDSRLLITFDPVYSAAAAFDRTSLGDELHFRSWPERSDGILLITDEETGSVWQALTGIAIEGPLAGQVLTELDSDLTTTYSWKELFSSTEFYA